MRIKIQSDLCRHDNIKVALDYMVGRKRQKSTGYEGDKRTQTSGFHPARHQEVRKSRLRTVLGGGRCGRVESWSSAVKAVMNSVYK